MPALAKLSRPKLAEVHPRERLFARLDECRQRAAAIWICGPPGAGKTTVAASYLDARGLCALWYHVDAGDADPASFFHHLGLGAKQAGLSRKTHLPLLTQEHWADLAGFSRRYFRCLYAGLPPSCVLVLDNVQDAPEASPFGAIMREALLALPQGTNAILVSRNEPPAEHARLRVSRLMAELCWDELQLTNDEAAHIAARSQDLRANLQGQGIEVLIERCGGWAAGLTLLLDHARATGAVAEPPQSRQALFDYFACELFDRLPPPTRHLLLRTALVPWFSIEMARSLSGRSDAGVLLEDLHHRHLFIERRAGALAGFRYHALLREFLEDRVERTYAAEERQRLAHDSALLLAGVEQTDAALKLHLVAGDHDAAVQLVLAHAARLVAQGRLHTLQARIGTLPATAPQHVPWLGYWLGVCQLGADPPAARAQLEAAFHRFAAAGDAVGQAVAAASIIGTHSVEFRNYALLDPWIVQLQRQLLRGLAFPDPALELGATGSLLGALLMRNADQDQLEPVAARVWSLLDTVPDVNSRVAGASRLLHFYTLSSNLMAGDQLIAYLRPHLNAPELSAHIHCQWLHFESFWFQMNRYDERRSAEAMGMALQLIECHELTHLAIFIRARAAHLRLDAADVEAAAAQLDRAVPTLKGGNDAGWHHGMQAWVALLRGDLQGAVNHAQLLVHECARFGTLHGYGISLLLQANVLAAAGDWPGSHGCLEQARATHVIRTPIGQFTAACIEADMQLACGNPAEAVPLLRAAFSLARRERVFNTLQWLAPQMSRLCAVALEHGIEADYVSQLIRVRGLRPASADQPAWPWPIKLYTLGRFDIVKDGEPLLVEGKTQRKPLALLKALVALGGKDVPEDELIDIVWCDSPDGDGQRVFEITVHRLRKLLGIDKAVRVTDRRVSLNCEIVWVDLFALERRLAAVMPSDCAAASGAAHSEIAASAILDLYRGHFLDGEAETAWLLPVRNRLKGRFQRFIMRLGGHWEIMNAWARAAQLYERAVELDPLAESFYARWMICLHRQGQRSEAIDVFRRCRQMLSLTLGVSPAQTTEAVYRELLG